MKKHIYVLCISLLFAAVASAQNIRLNAYGNYSFDDKVDSYYSNNSYFSGTVKGGFLWGGGLEFRIKQYYGIELLYLRLDTHAPIEYYDYNNSGLTNADFDLSFNYIMAAGARSIPVNEKVEGFGGIMLGVAIMDAKNPKTGRDGSATEFAWGLRGGVNIWAAERVGLKMQAMLLSVPQGSGGSFYFGTGGVGAGVSSYSSVLQFSLGGGLTFKLGGAAK